MEPRNATHSVGPPSNEDDSFVKIIKGDLLEASETFICHQCNCVTTNAGGLAQALFDRYPYANSYAKRNPKDPSTHSAPSTIEICGNNSGQRYIINMFAQYYPGLPSYPTDDVNKRLSWFRKCLVHIARIPHIQNYTLAMPYNIGCGLAGGNWDIYYGLISQFALKERINIVLYKLV
jgi:O-acetyl-ADP-ribose deacetylase (regulator of RNase III)